MRLFHLAAKEKVSAHPEWNGCTTDRRCQVWTTSDEARARELAHAKFWQEATPVKADRTSPWTDPDMVTCAEADILPGMPVPVDEAVFGWEDRVVSPVPIHAGRDGGNSAPSEDPSKKLDQR